MRILCGRAHRQLGDDICKCLQIAPGLCEVSSFADGETQVKILDDVRGLDVFVVQSTCPPVNESLMELLVMVDALRRASARRITAVVPYYGYARQDRKHEGRVPITAKLVANLCTTAGIDRMLCMDLHAQQIQGFFDIPLDHLQAKPVIAHYLRQKNLQNIVFVSPDVGSVKLADGYARLFGCDFAIIEKRRTSDTEIKHGHLIGSVKDKHVIIVDDMISTAGSMASGIEVARQHGALSVTIAATHGLFVGPAWKRLAEAKPDEIITTNTVPQEHQQVPEGLSFTPLSVAPTLAEAIMRIHHDKSVSQLFAPGHLV